MTFAGMGQEQSKKDKGRGFEGLGAEANGRGEPGLNVAQWWTITLLVHLSTIPSTTEK